jgi:hypothetical protein
VSLNNRAVDHCVFEIGSAADFFENSLKYATLSPSAKPSEHAVPVAEISRQVAPR